MDLGLSPAYAVVTGGSKGMGRAVAERLAREGASVAVLARGQRALEDTVQALHAAGSTDSFGLSVDFTDPAAINAGFSAIAERWDHVNVLVHTIGPAGGTFENLDDEAWDRTLDLGTMSTVRAIRAALPLLRAAEWGRIATFAASSIRRPNDRTIAYTAAKAASASITKTLAKSLAADGLDATDPVDVMTWIGDHFGERAALGRAGLPDEVASLTAYLVSRTNGYVTGACVNVDGGSDF